jgi:hypothetical protein
MRRFLPFLWVISVLLPHQVSAQVFTPVDQTVSVAATPTTARVQIRTSASSRYVRVFNAGTVTAWVGCGDVSVVAVATTSMPVGPGGTAVIGCAQQYVAAVTTTTATVYFTPGEAN